MTHNQAVCPICRNEQSPLYPLRIAPRFRLVECVACGHLEIEPQPSDGDLDCIYSSGYYAAWGEGGSAETTAQLKRRTADLVLDHVPKGGRLLDCGATYGYLLEMAKARGFDCYGIERNPTASDRLERLFGDGHAWTGMVENAEFPALPKEGAFSVITMCDFIEHVRDPIFILKKAGTLLAPGGTLLITTPDGGGRSRKLMGDRWLHFKEEHLHYFSRKSLEIALTSAGLKLAHITPATKCVSLSYLQTQFSTYSPKSAGALLKCLRPMITRNAWNAPLSFSFGELFATAKKAELGLGQGDPIAASDTGAVLHSVHQVP